MGYNYEWIDDNRVEVNVAAAFRRMDAAFRAAFGFGLHINDGTRTRAEQQDLWDRKQRGEYPYAVARPGTSNHEEDGPNGPRAIDIRDEGGDSGVMTRGTRRDRWMQDHAGEYGFENEGYNFGEAWHKKFTGTIGGSAGGGAGGASNLTERSTADIQRLVGADPDNIWGPDTDAKVRAWQSCNGLEADGIWGPLSDAKGFPPAGAGSNQTSRSTADIQRLVGADPDNIWGPDTDRKVRAWQTANGLEADGIWGPISDAKGFPPAAPAPTQPAGDVGRNATDRPTSEIQTFLGITPDNDYGPGTTAAVKGFQTEQGIDVDGIWGQTSDGLAFPPKGSIHGVDYSFARPDINMLVNRGVKIVLRYLASLENKKGLQRAEYDTLVSAGMEVVFIYEEDGKELLGGYDEGVRVAKKAEEHRLRNGFPAKPIYFNVDFDAPASDVPQIAAALRGVASVIGKERTGLYAGVKIISVMFDLEVIEWGFQTYAWSGGRWDQRAQLQQWSNGQWGDSVDFTRAVTRSYGQYAVDPKPVPVPVPVPVPTPTPEPSILAQIKAKFNELGSLIDKL